MAVPSQAASGYRRGRGESWLGHGLQGPRGQLLAFGLPVLSQLSAKQAPTSLTWKRSLLFSLF